MAAITVIGGTGYAGGWIVKEAAERGHTVTSLSRSEPAEPVAGVRYLHGDATDPAVLADAVAGADAIVAALSPRGPLAGRQLDTYRPLAELAEKSGARLVVVGGFSTLRPAPGAPRFVEGEVPEQFRAEALEGADILYWLQASPEDLHWTYVSPAGEFGSYAPGEKVGSYRLGGEIALFDENGKTAVSGPDYATAIVDIIEGGEHRRAHVGVAY